jgi:hypothetical protein
MDKLLLFLIFLLTIFLVIAYVGNVYRYTENYMSPNQYPRLGCNGDAFTHCVEEYGITWCATNCTNANAISPCVNNGNNDNNNNYTWQQCVADKGISWCQNNCRDVNNNLYTPILSEDIL